MTNIVCCRSLARGGQTSKFRANLSAFTDTWLMLVRLMSSDRRVPMTTKLSGRTADQNLAWNIKLFLDIVLCGDTHSVVHCMYSCKAWSNRWNGNDCIYRPILSRAICSLCIKLYFYPTPYMMTHWYLNFSIISKWIMLTYTVILLIISVFAIKSTHSSLGCV